MPNIVTLVCENCASRNYQTNKNKFLPKRLELKKFCKNCNATTIHKETR